MDRRLCGEAFAAAVRAALDLAERTGAGLSPEQRGAAVARFATAARYERRFWDMGWREERWPV